MWRKKADVQYPTIFLASHGALWYDTMRNLIRRGISVMTNRLTDSSQPRQQHPGLAIQAALCAGQGQSEPSDQEAGALTEARPLPGQGNGLAPGDPAGPPRISVVLPVFDERETLPELHRRLSAVLTALGEPFEMIFVDDGSRDGSAELLYRLQQSDHQVRVLRLSRNFGHQTAISAGIDHARGDAIVLMDADLQDPPEELPALLDHWRQGAQVVYAVRQQRKEAWPMRAAYSFFYRLLRQLANVEIPLDSGDFCVMDRCVADVLRQMPERNRFLRGIRSWIGFRQVGVPYQRAARFAGRPKYNLFRLLRLAFDGFFSFSYVPLRLASLFGLVVSFLGFLLSLWTIYKRFTLPEFPSGFATIVVGMMFLGGIQLIALGVIGEYVGRIFDEVKQRPLYIVSQRWGFDDTE